MVASPNSVSAIRRPVVRINRPYAPAAAGARAPVNLLNKQKIGLLGGSFNPAHQGHRAISLEAIRRLDLDQVWWLVSPQNPLKSRRDMADLKARMASAEQVAAGHPKLIVTDLEQTLGTTYTVDTVRRLVRDGRRDYVWLIGADNLVQLPKWRSWRQLLNLVPIAVFDREPYSYPALAGLVARAYAARRVRVREAADLPRMQPPAWVYFRLRRHQVSSTRIRSRGIWPAGKEPETRMLAQSGQMEGTLS